MGEERDRRAECRRALEAQIALTPAGDDEEAALAWRARAGSDRQSERRSRSLVHSSLPASAEAAGPAT